MSPGQPMSDLDLADMRARLLKLREEIESLAATSEESSEVVQLDPSRVGRLSRMDAMQAQAMAQASGRRREILLRRISTALARIDTGEYGLCGSCDEPIPKKRLEFDPAVVLCVRCAEEAERS
jgi:DnaK suppressor protein